MASVQCKDILIAVLGVTGAGKITFISKSTGRTDLVIDHGVESCALRRRIQLFEWSLITFLNRHAGYLVLESAGRRQDHGFDRHARLRRH